MKFKLIILFYLHLSLRLLLCKKKRIKQRSAQNVENLLKTLLAKTFQFVWIVFKKH